MQKKTTPNPVDESAIRDLLQRLGEAWDRGDADAYASLFTEDADYAVFDGTHLKGRQEISDTHRPLFERFMKGSCLFTESSSMRFLSPDVALIHSKGAVLRTRQKHPSSRRLSVQTMVAVRGEEGWRFVAFQNTRYRPFTWTLLGRVLVFARLLPRPE
jgi:uncharacterized protein (TIGR02246 family)